MKIQRFVNSPRCVFNLAFAILALSVPVLNVVAHQYSWLVVGGIELFMVFAFLIINDRKWAITWKDIIDWGFNDGKGET